MKLIIILIFPFAIYSQVAIPVVDGALAGQVTGVNGKLYNLNRKQAKTNRKLTSLKRKLNKVNKQLEQANATLEKLTNLKEEEIKAYKKAPEELLVKYQKNLLNDLKLMLANKAKSVVLNLGNYKKITLFEKEQIKNRIISIVDDVVSIWIQTNSLLEVNDRIIPAGERQEMLSATIEIIEDYINELTNQDNYLKIIDNERKTTKELIGF